jgi:glycosyltransferase involved in cell wall biosynthesis
MLANATANSNESIVLSINSLQGAGAEKFVLTIGEAFYKLGFDVHVLRFDPKVEYILSDNLTYHFINYQQYRWLPKGKLRYSILAKKVDSYIKKNIGTPTLILSNLERSDNIFYYSCLANVMYVIHSTLSLYYDFANVENVGALKLRLKNIYSKHPCVCVSEGVKEDFINHIGKIASITTIHNPVDRDSIQLLSEAFVPEFENYIVHIGSFKKAKRHDVLLKAYAKTEQTLPLLLLGQGKLKNDIEQLILELGLQEKVFLLGFCENPYPYLKRAQFKTLTSDREGFPMVIEEALALGTPVISTDCQSGPREMLPENNLMIINDIDSIANKLNQAMITPLQFKAEFNEALLPHNIAKKYLDFNKKCCEKKF